MVGSGTRHSRINHSGFTTMNERMLFLLRTLYQTDRLLTRTKKIRGCPPTYSSLNITTPPGGSYRTLNKNTFVGRYHPVTKHLGIKTEMERRIQFTFTHNEKISHQTNYSTFKLWTSHFLLHTDSASVIDACPNPTFYFPKQNNWDSRMKSSTTGSCCGS